MPQHEFLRNTTLEGNFSGNSLNSPEDSFDFIQPNLVSRVISGVLFVLIAIIGGVGNTLVLVVLKKTPMKKTTRYITAMLATNDLLGCLVNIPLAFASVIVRPPEDTLYSVTLAHTTLTLVAVVGNHFCFVLLSIDRSDFIRSSSMRQPRLTPRRVKKLLVLLLVTSVVVGILTCYTSAENPFFLRRPKKTARYRVKNVFRGIIIALGILSSSLVIRAYYRVRKHLKNHSKMTSQINGMPQRSQAEEEREKALAKTMIAILISFYGQYLPLTITSILWHRNYPVLGSTDNLVICRTFFLTHYATNIWIYIAGNRGFRLQLVNLLRDLFTGTTTPGNIDQPGLGSGDNNVKTNQITGCSQGVALPMAVGPSSNVPEHNDQTGLKSYDTVAVGNIDQPGLGSGDNNVKTNQITGCSQGVALPMAVGPSSNVPEHNDQTGLKSYDTVAVGNIDQPGLGSGDNNVKTNQITGCSQGVALPMAAGPSLNAPEHNDQTGLKFYDTVAVELDLT